MNEQYYKWYSQELGTETEMLVFGHGGQPMILFPTSKGRFYQNKDFGLIESISWFIGNGLIKVYCPDSFDEQSWYNKSVPPSQRVLNHLKYERMLFQDVIPRALQETGLSRLILAGCSFGGYHAGNLSFKYPEMVSNLFSMSGTFDIRSMVDGYYDDNIYYNNPVDFLPNLHSEALYDLGIILGTGEYDICLHKNIEFCKILNQKEIQHWLDNRLGANHDWPVWRDMLPLYLSKVNY